MDDNGHGTHVAGTISAVTDNGIGVAGVSWNSKIMAVKFLGSTGGGSTANAIEAVLYSTMMGADLSNNSWGGGAFSAALEDAIAAAGDANKLFISSAGNASNNNDVTPAYPASYELDNIISVAALDHNNELASFSSFGANSVDLGAPGVAILSTSLSNGESISDPSGYTSISGTSMASPHVAGAAALLLAHFPGISAENLKARIVQSADKIPAMNSISVSGGALNLSNALETDNQAPAGPYLAFVNIEAATARSVSLSWPQSGDDGNSSGIASAYEIAISTQLFSQFEEGETFYTVPATDEPIDSIQYATISGLQPATTYFLYIRAVDNVGNKSYGSSVFAASTYSEQLLFSEDFSSLNAWTIDGFFGPEGHLWHLGSHRFSSPSSALYYGLDSTLTYNTGSSNFGTATSPEINLIGVEAPTLNLSHFYEREGGSAWDRARIEVLIDGTAVGTLFDATLATNGSLQSASFDLSAYADELIQLRFSFDTVDSILNDNEGWVIDDLIIGATGDPVFLDEDNDGVADQDDLCFGSPPNYKVNEDGCHTIAFYSMSPDRSNPQPLSGASFDSNDVIYIFADIPESEAINSVFFYLDGDLVREETKAPYDLQSGSATAANPFYVSELNTGWHYVFPLVWYPDGTSVSRVEGFTVSQAQDEDGDGVSDTDDLCPGTPAGTPVDSTGCAIVVGDSLLTYSLSSDRSSPVDADGASFESDDLVYVFLNVPSGDGIDSVTFRIDGELAKTESKFPFDLAGGSNASANPMDLSGLSEGAHELSAEVAWSNGETTLNVANFNLGTVVSDPDSDGDGVPDGTDLCPDTPADTPVDSDGCPLPAEEDSDNDGVPDSLDLCPGTPPGSTVDEDGCVVDNSGNLLVFSTGSDRSSPNVLASSEFSGSETIYVFIDAANGDDISSVDFYINGEFERTESLHPFDLFGGSASNAKPFNLSSLSPGSHMVSAVVNWNDASTSNFEGAFQIIAPNDSDNDGVPDELDLCPGTPEGDLVDSDGCTVTVEGPSLVYSMQADRSNELSLNEATFTTEEQIYIFLNVENGDGIDSVSFFLNGELYEVQSAHPYDFAGGSAASPTPLNTSDLGAGVHILDSLVNYSNGSSAGQSAIITVE
jgi:hypothetical protein